MASPEIPSAIGRFEVLELLGRGGVGSVYLARDPQLDRKVAVKTLSVLEGLPAEEQAEARARFFREARAAAALNHPNIVTVFEVGQEEGLPYIAMELLQGRTLDRHTKPGHLLEPAQVISVGIQAARALEVAHAAGIVHRDIKPANLVLHEDGTLKVMDFGLAKDPRTTLTSDQDLLGTPGYMSPEQIAGRRLDGRSDLFSLAVSLYEMLSGQRPFPGDSVSSVLYRIVNEPPVPLSRVVKGLPAELEAFFMRALAKDVTKRPESGAEFGEQLARIAQQFGEEERTAPLPPPGPRARDRSASRDAREESDGDDPSDIVSGAPPEAAFKESPPRRGRWILLALFLVLAAVAAAWSAPLWSDVDPLGEQRAPVENWLSENLGAFGDFLRTTPPELRVLVETDPPGLALRIEPEGVGRLEGGGELVLPGDLDEELSILVDDRCFEGSLSIRPGFVNSRETLTALPRRESIPVISSPEGAAVSLDGERQPELTPTELSLELCKAHEVTLSKRGFVATSVALDAADDADTWTRALATLELSPPAPSLVVVPEAPYPVDVYASGQTGRVASAGSSFSLPAGSVRLTLLSSRVFYREVIELRLRPGGETRVPVSYPPLGKLAVRSVPPGARVEVRDHRGRWKSVGETPLNELTLVSGEHELRISRDGGAGPRVIRRVMVRSDKNEPVLVGKSDWSQ